jgi:LPS-assembly protein
MPGREGQRRGRHESARARRRGVSVALCAVGAILCVSVAVGVPARAQGQSVRPDSSPALITADEVNYDEQLGVVTARGNVEVAQGERVLRADVVSFNRLTNVVTATGNVSIAEPTGDVIFADYVEMSDQLKDGTIQNFRALLADQSRVAAVSARRSNGNTTIARRVVYSACDLCKEDPTRPPVWQIKAARITHDQQAQQIQHHDARMEILGVPVAYTPYLAHPDGTAERQSGFLAPEFKSSSTLGQLVTIPYYWAIDDSSDATFEPIFLTNEAPVLAGEYRQKTAKGQIQTSASITQTDRRDNSNNRLSEKDTRGHIKTRGRFDIDDDWRWGFQGERATDDTYLQRYRLQQRYRFLSSQTLTSNLYTEGFRDRNYAAANAYAFQGLRETDDPGLAPVVLPMMDYNLVTEPGELGGRYSFDANALSIYRSEGTRMQRTVMRGAWSLPWVAPSGEIYSLTASVRGDIYNTSQIGSAADPFRPTEDGVHVRAIPQLQMSWRYPLIRRDADVRTIIEPIVAVGAAPKLNDQNRFPNEDSRAVEFDETNLFRASRFNGLDRVEGGQHVDYGFNSSIVRDNGTRAGMFLGQSYRFQNESAFPANSGLAGHQSHYVGRLDFAPHPWFSTRYNFQLSQEDFSAQRNRASISLGPTALRVSFSYIFIDRLSQTNLNNNIEQLGTTVNARLSPNWRTQARYLTSLADNDTGSLTWGGSLIYEDECLLTGIDLTRRYTGTRDNPPDTAILLRVVFRNLGEIKTNVF